MSQSTSKWLIDVGSLLKFERNVFTRFCQPLNSSRVRSARNQKYYHGCCISIYGLPLTPMDQCKVKEAFNIYGLES